METTPDEQIRYWLHCLESACKLADDAGGAGKPGRSLLPCT